MASPPGARIRSSSEALRLLTRTERTGFLLGAFICRHWPGASRAWSVVLCPLLWLAFGRRLRVFGLEHLRGVRPSDPVVLTANHRSFFDFYVTALVIRWRARWPHRLLFPVRAPFLYDHPLGVALNFLVSGMSMFPPIFRDRRGRSLNEMSLGLCATELRRPGTLIGVHPEGTRNRGPDPFSLLPVHRGVGRLVLSVPGTRAFPEFVSGLGQRIGVEIWRNWTAPGRHPVDVRFGPEIDLADLRRSPEGTLPEDPGASAERSAVERCRAAILDLARAAREAAGPSC